MRRLARVLAVSALCLVPAQVGAGGFWKPFVAGVATGFVTHEASHLLLDVAFDTGPRLKGVRFGPIPFFALTHRSNTPPRQEALISGAGFVSQHVWAEVVLSGRSPDDRVGPFNRGVLAFHVATSVAYAGAAFARRGPHERDTRGVAEATGTDERLIGVLALAPAAFDSWRYFRPESKTAKWGSRLAKVGFVAVLAIKK